MTAASTKPLNQGTPARSRVGSPPSPAAKSLEKPTDRLARRASAATEALETIGAALGFGAMMTDSPKLQLDSMAFGIHAGTVGPSLAQFAEKNSFAAALIDRSNIVTGAAGIGMAIMPLIYQVMANHRAGPQTTDDGTVTTPEFPPLLLQMGILPPHMLAAQYQADLELKMAQRQAEILRKTQAAKDELARLQTTPEGE